MVLAIDKYSDTTFLVEYDVEHNKSTLVSANGVTLEYPLFTKIKDGNLLQFIEMLSEEFIVLDI